MLPIKPYLLALFLLLGGFLPYPLAGQFVVDTSYTPKEIVSDVLLGAGIKVKNVRYQGSKISIGHFVNQSKFPDVSEGIILSTGSVFDVAGPNKVPSMGRIMGQRGDHELDEIARGMTMDATVLEFDFMAQKDSIHFFYFFGSEEYNEYVGSEFNDVFAFFISGPGYDERVNIAAIRDTRIWPISVNTVNNNMNRRQYIDNNYWNSRNFVIKGREKELNPVLLANLELDGITRVLRARARVIPGKVYHIKIAIADVGDGRYDSAVFLEAHTFTSEPYVSYGDRHHVGKIPASQDTSFADSGWDSLTTGGKPEFIPTFGRPLPQQPTYSKDTFPPVPGSVQDEKIAYRFAVEFDFDSDELTEDALKNLAIALEKARKIKGVTVELRGHTDIVGDHAYNQDLSERRANRVAQFFQDAGMKSGRIRTEGHSFDQPVAPNTTTDGRARNRRVEVIFNRSSP